MILNGADTQKQFGSSAGPLLTIVPPFTTICLNWWSEMESNRPPEAFELIAGRPSDVSWAAIEAAPVANSCQFLPIPSYCPPLVPIG